jgi:ribosomal-protein-alanine N-acetyltransferase
MILLVFEMIWSWYGADGNPVFARMNSSIYSLSPLLTRAGISVPSYQLPESFIPSHTSHGESAWISRFCTVADLQQVLEIELVAYAQPWTIDQFVQELQAGYSRILVLFEGPELAGYLCFWLVSQELHILNIATAPAFRRRGIARRLLAQAFELGREQQVEAAFLEVRRSNTGAIGLYRALGFVENCLRPKYYPDGEDALLMSCILTCPSSSGAPR